MKKEMHEVTPFQAAKIIGFNTETVWKYIREQKPLGKLFYKRGKNSFAKLEDIVEFAATIERNKAPYLDELSIKFKNTEDDRNLIDSAARKANLTPTEFARKATVEAAKNDQ